MFNRSLGRFLAAAFGAFLCMPALSQTPAATGTWARVPALPTACYTGTDPAMAKLDTAFEVIQADRYKQSDINAQIEETSRNVDPMETARRVQQKMMADPQNAAKYIEQMQNLGQDIQAQTVPTFEKEAQMKTESEALMKRYQAALDAAYAPGNARWTALKKKLGIAPDSYGPGELGVPDWAWTEWDVILREWDRGYAATCPQWWAVGGQVHAYMKRYKDYLVKERIPYDEQHDVAKVANYEMTNVSHAAYKSVATFEAAEDYIKRAQELFGQRKDRPRCTADRCN